MVNVHDSESSSLGSRPGLGHCIVFSQGRTLYFRSPSLSQVYKWVVSNLELARGEPCDGLAPYPGESVNTQSCFITGISSGRMGHLACKQT